jgi:tetratricopeptide (TPR) repeat protein
MIEVLYRLPKTSISKKEMIDECRAQYADNSVQLRMIDEFYNKYNENLSIDWYTKDCFLYRLLNKAFRTENIDIIFNYHYFLSDLTKELTKLYVNQYGDKTGTLTVYRGQHIHIDELQKLQNSIGRLMSINTFFSTTTSSSVAADFSGNGEYRYQGFESIIFQIEIDLSIQRRPFAKIGQFSSNKDENEILFAIGSIFRIESVELYLDNIWLIVLTLTNEVKKEIEDLLEYFTKHIGTQPSLLELGVLLSKTGDFERAENHYDLGVLHNNLGEIYRQQGYFDIAMQYYKLAIDELVESFGFLHLWFAIVHSNIATTYNARRQFDQSLIHFRCALFIMKRCRIEYEEELFSTIYHGMATTFVQKGQLKTALEFYDKTSKIELNILPSNHPSIAMTFNNIGQLYFEMKDYSKALENFLKAFPIMLSTLPNNHPQLAQLYANIGSAYSKQNEISKSIKYLLEAEQIIDRSTLTSDHQLREDIYRTLGIVSRDNKMIDLSIRMHYRLIDILKAQIPSDQYKIADCTCSLGYVLFNQGDHQQSFECYQLALDIIQQLPRTEKNKYLYNDIINSLLHTKHVDIAIEHYTRLLDEEMNAQSLFAGKLHNNLGTAYDLIDNNHLAIKHYREALNCYLNKSEIFAKEIAVIHHNIAIILDNLGDYEDARSNLHKALDILDNTDHQFHSRCHYILGKINEKTNDLNCARIHFDHAIELSMQENHPNHTMIKTYTFCLQQVMKKIENNTSTNLEPIQKSNED